ncbi:MAG TPA: signal peptidase II [Brachybacterium massiliense]|uniref:Lipoprotein signal peptidase n=1 Tax=Brachybacterium massiliense TaxID=1755098 RepID=A0A921SX16_9MICO|nr:signal peptidase II [Brachybacterium massiliense]
MNSALSQSASAGPEGSGARRRLSRRTVLWTIAAIGAVIAVIDQITKNWAVDSLPLLEPQPFIGEILQLTLLYNSGAAWGMGAEITPVVTCLQLVIVAGVIVFAVKAVRSPWYTAALGLIMGGALGNIHDRLLREPGPFRGAVVDFLELPNWPVFNIADMAVVGGAIMIVALGLFGVASDPAHDEEDSSAEGTGETAQKDAV